MAHGKILVVEDDAAVGKRLVRGLERAGFSIEWCADGFAGLTRALDPELDLVILDLMLPGADGFEVLERLARDLSTPIIVLSAKDGLESRLRAFDLGAIDFVAKPFWMEELVVRIHRRLGKPKTHVIRWGPVELDMDARQVRVDGADARLTPTELGLLRLLAARRARGLARGARRRVARWGDRAHRRLARRPTPEEARRGRRGGAHRARLRVPPRARGGHVKLQRGLAIRILVVSLALGAISAAAGVASSAEAYRDAVTNWITERWGTGLGDVMLARCLADPAGFHGGDGVGVRIHAFDAATGRSADPEGAPEDPADLASLGSAPEPPSVPRSVYTAFVRGAPSGPCSAFRITFDARAPVRGRVLRNIGIAVLAVSVAALVFVFLIVVAPLRRRIARVRTTAALVGSTEYVNEEREARDELGDVARSIHLAHERIRGDHDALEASRRALERFLGDVAHDLRTPLTSLRLALEELDDAGLDDATREVLRAAFNDVVYASSLTENLKLASQLEHGTEGLPKATELDLVALADRVALREASFARRSRMQLTAELPDAPFVVEADPVLVEQAISNVVQNAIIHGEPGGRIELRLSCDGDGFRLEVLDDGPGVPPEALPRIGERSYRSDAARSRDPKGSGLGLAITTEVCERFGWRVVFESRDPRGLRVTIRG